jgi:hypothetical protein
MKLIYGFTQREPIGNLAFHVGDDIEAVNAHHLLLASEFGYERDALVHMKQIHSNIVHVVSEEDGFITPPTCDGLVTNRKNIPLMVMVADCTPVLFLILHVRLLAWHTQDERVHLVIL